jgi:hypothetical protein
VAGNVESVDGGGIVRQRRPWWSRSLRVTGRWLPLAIWFVAVGVLVAGLAISHWFTLPRPDKRDTQLAAGLAELLRDRPGWAAIHVLYTSCRCSQRIVDHLVESSRPADVHEVIVLVGSDRAMEARIRARGYQIVTAAPEELRTRFAIESAPLLVIVDPARNARYVGGYTRRQQGSDIQDLALMTEIRTGGELVDLPVFGCAVSQRLKTLASP